MKEGLLQKAEQWIEENRDRLVQDITRLVNIKSISAPDSSPHPYGQGCRDVLDEMFRIGEEHGFSWEEYDGRCGALWLHEAQETVGFWGHLDVVPEGDNWIYQPYNALVKDGYLFGRGTSDNKGPAVAALYAVKALEEAGIPLRRAYRVYVGLSEETGMSDVEYFREHYPCPDLSIVPDAEFPVCYAEKGIMQASFCSAPISGGRILEVKGGLASNVVPDTAELRLRKEPGLLAHLENLPQGVTVEEQADSFVVRAQGLTRHVAMPEGGVNAIYLLTSALVDAQVLEGAEASAFRLFTDVNRDYLGTGAGVRCEDDISGYLTCVGSMIFLEEGRLRLHMNIRYPVKADAEEMQRNMHEVAEKYNCTALIEEHSKPNYFPKEHPLVEQLTAVYNQLRGAQAKPYVMGGGTYARKLPNAFAFGMEFPGAKMPAELPDGHGGVHQPDECLCVEDLVQAVKIFCRCLAALDEMELPKS